MHFCLSVIDATDEDAVDETIDDTIDATEDDVIDAATVDDYNSAFENVYGEIAQLSEPENGKRVNLNSPEVWIGDTGATAHNTAFLIGTTNHREPTSTDGVLGFSGPPAKAKMIVDIPMKVTGGMQTEMKDVTYVPSARYNLFSITKMMKAGWLLSGNMNEGLVLTMPNQPHIQIRFDEKVYTTKGVLFAAKFKRLRPRLVETIFRYKSSRTCNLYLRFVPNQD